MGVKHFGLGNIAWVFDASPTDGENDNI